MTQDAIGKVVITYQDAYNQKFTESPFYVNANLLKDVANENVANNLRGKIYDAVAQMSDLTTATLLEVKVVYEITCTSAE